MMVEFILFVLLWFHSPSLSLSLSRGSPADLIGADSWETALVDVVGEMLDDLMKPLVEKVIFEKDEAKKVV